MFLISTQRKATLMSVLSRNLCVMGCMEQICTKLQCIAMEMKASTRVRLKPMGMSAKLKHCHFSLHHIKNAFTHCGQKSRVVRGVVLTLAAARHHLRQRPSSVKLRSNYTEGTKVTKSHISLSDVPKPRNS